MRPRGVPRLRAGRASQPWAEATTGWGAGSGTGEEVGPRGAGIKRVRSVDSVVAWAPWTAVHVCVRAPVLPRRSRGPTQAVV